MSKTPIKVLIRARPTANYAHQNINIDENTGYIEGYAATSTSIFPSRQIKDSSTTNKKTGGSSSKRC